jgi:hypothetical protein
MHLSEASAIARESFYPIHTGEKRGNGLTTKFSIVPLDQGVMPHTIRWGTQLETKHPGLNRNPSAMRAFGFEAFVAISGILGGYMFVPN